MTSIVRSTHSVPTHAWTTPTNGCLPSNTYQNNSDDVHRGSKFGNPACTPQFTLAAACPAPPHRQPPLSIYSGYAETLCPDIDNSEVPCIDEQAVADLSNLQSVSQAALPCESSDMRKLMMHAKPISTASQLLSRIRQAPMADNQSQFQSNRCADVYMTRPRPGEKRKLSSLRAQLDYMGKDLCSESHAQLVSNVADRAVPLWQEDMAARTELTQRPKRAARGCFAQLQEFDRMHIKANDPAMGPLKIPRGTAGPGLKSLVSGHRFSQQSSYFLGSQQQPLFLTTFDMPLEAPPPLGLRPFYGHPWPWSACPQPHGNGPSTDGSSPQHGEHGSQSGYSQV
ncbi:MAG: hypothetical protein FRX49_07017 [Trebouxia sp. A1-2]|nr:MAG: hypothetical protein FRX49_07017 [Trebouxia sp. A1-2]